MTIKFNMTPLAQVPIGARVEIERVEEASELGERLMELGLTPGIVVEVVRRGPFGDPLQLSVRGYMLSMRKAQASAIFVRPIE